jgi:8-oxo-dGTP pyrophosphatase MutT (NUDIX family)
MTSSVSVIVEDPRSRVLLLQRSATDRWMPGRWNLPGGGIDPGESASTAAMREAFEEAGLRVFALSPFLRTGSHLTFRADDWDGRVRLRDGEHSRAAWAPRGVAWTWDLVPRQSEVLRRYAGVLP